MRRALLTTTLLAAAGVLACSSGTPQRPHDPPGYDEWWYPACQTVDGSCPSDTCLHNQIVAIKDRCGPYQNLEVGCVTRNTAVAGWFCVMRRSTGELIYTQYSPKGGDFVECTDIPTNLPPMDGALCRDGGTD